MNREIVVDDGWYRRTQFVTTYRSYLKKGNTMSDKNKTAGSEWFGSVNKFRPIVASTRRSVLKGATALGVGSAAGTGIGASESSSSEMASLHEADPWTVISPDGSIEATIARNDVADVDSDLPDGEGFTLTVEHDGTTVLEPSPLGISTFSADFVTELSVTGVEVETISETININGGQRSQFQHEAKQATLTLESEAGTLQIDLRVANDGAAYRYRLPGDGDVVVTNEASSFRLPNDSQTWLAPFGEAYEGLWNETSAESASGAYGFPVLSEVGNDSWLLLTEADVTGRYGASHLFVDDADDEGSDEATDENEDTDYDDNPYLFELVFADTFGLSETISSTLPLATPWRTAIIGDLASVTESNLVLALNDPSNVEDTSWIEPGRVAWSWWSDSGSPQDLEVQKQYVDYASEQGWEFSLVDRGWDRDWMSELVEYADDQSVDIIAWLPWYYVNDETKREAVLSRLADWGVSGIKVDYMNADFQQYMEFYDEILEATADCELMINFHGSTLPRGRRRQWPHLMTNEAGRGAEYYKFGELTPTHNVILPFTRNVVGPLDYTPVTFSADDRETSDGHELALSVVYQSDWQHFADSVESYRDRPIAERFLSEVPAVWDESTLVNGRPGEEATIARRSNNEWYVGSIIAGEARTVDVPLSFLQDDDEYTAELIHDSSGGNGLEATETTVTADDTLSLDVPVNGGFTLHIR